MLASAYYLSQALVPAGLAGFQDTATLMPVSAVALTTELVRQLGAKLSEVINIGAAVHFCVATVMGRSIIPRATLPHFHCWSNA